jgi:hypothetical protein
MDNTALAGSQTSGKRIESNRLLYVAPRQFHQLIHARHGPAKPVEIDTVGQAL